MTSSTKTPLWLDIRPEYLDANLENLISYLSREAYTEGQDEFYDTTLALLRQRVKKLISTLSGRTLSEEEEAYSSNPPEEKDTIRMLGCMVLLCKGKMDALEREAFFFLVKSLCPLAPSYLDGLVSVAMKALTRSGATNPGFAWEDLRNLRPEVLAHKIVNNSVFATTPCPNSWYQNQGTLFLKGEQVQICAMNREDTRRMESSLATGLSILDEDIIVLSSTQERVKKSELTDFGVLSAFTSGIIQTMSQTVPSPEVRLAQYKVGDILPVRITGKDYTNSFEVESLDEDHVKLTGKIPYKSMTSPLMYQPFDFAERLRVGDSFDVKITRLSPEGCTFNLVDTFAEALAYNIMEQGNHIPAIVKSRKRNKKGNGDIITFWTMDGYPALMTVRADEYTDLNPGDLKMIKLDFVHSNGYIDASIVENDDEVPMPFDEGESRDFAIKSFTYPEDFAFKKAPAVKTLSGSFIRGLCRLLFIYQKSEDKPSERYRIMCVCRILSGMTGDDEAARYLDTAAAYLRSLVLFATDRISEIKELEVPAELAAMPHIQRRQRVLRVLMEYGKDNDSALLSEYIHNDPDPVIRKVAKLVQSCNRVDDVLPPSMKNIIKREITRILSAETEDSTDLEENQGTYLGIENSSQEFKTSFFIAPSDAKIQNQEKNIFKSLCAFLNTEDGGTLYLGVNDLGYVQGIDSDLEYLKKKIQRGYSGLDGYIRYITDRAKVYFNLDVVTHFKIEPKYQDRVVAIEVSPYSGGIVTLEDVSYIRLNSESVQTTQAIRRQIQARISTQVRDKNSNVVALQKAISEKRCVTLMGYASSSRGTTHNCDVEPYAFVGNFTLVWCFDRDDKANKLYRISRIGNVKVQDREWENASLHLPEEKRKTDIFYMTGMHSTHVRMELDLMAKNLLVEEYPLAQKDVQQSSDQTWILDTEVYSLMSLCRFYLGLAPNIKILEGEDLKVFIEKYLKSHFPSLKVE